jgi:hypothetical protein
LKDDIFILENDNSEIINIFQEDGETDCNKTQFDDEDKGEPWIDQDFIEEQKNTLFNYPDAKINFSKNLPEFIETKLIKVMDVQNNRRSDVREILIQLYEYLISKIKKLKEKEIHASQEYENIRLKVFGLTITAASRNATAISNCGCTFALVEEAGEITEGNY